MKTRITLFDETEGRRSVLDITEFSDHLSDMRKTRNHIMRYLGQQVSAMLRDGREVEAFIVERELK
jgi:hypothetical protein